MSGFADCELSNVIGDHRLKQIDKLISFPNLCKIANSLETKLGRKGYSVEVGIRSIFLQFLYDLSDRELEERIRLDIAFRWFLGFNISDTTPDHTYFSRFRKSLGTNLLGKIFDAINQKAIDEKIIRGVFHFADATAIKVKETTWTERDKAIAEGEDKLNNSNIKDYAADKDARFGCKGKKKYWFGYKAHTSVDMSSNFVEKIAITPANISDQDGFRHVCPKGGMVFADKAYCLKPAQLAMAINKCHSGAILKNNMLGKNKDKDRWISSLRSPFEGVFSKMLRKNRYRGWAKVQFQAFIEAIVHNVKRWLVINIEKGLSNS